MVSQISQRLEDRSRDKGKERERVSGQREEERGTARENETRTGHTNPRIEEPRKVTFAVPENENIGIARQNKERWLRSRKLPFVDLPPLKATPRVPLTEPVRSDQNSKNEVTYRTVAPVEQEVDIPSLVKDALDIMVSVPLRSLAGASNAILKEVKKQVTKVRVPIEDSAKVNLLAEDERPLIKIENLPQISCIMQTEASSDVPEGYFVANDPVLQYLSEHKEANPGDFVAARPSEDLRAIYMAVNKIKQEECLLDSGSQIVSMAKSVAIENGLNWDPSIRINMESASNHLEKTLGLARDVKFSVGGIDVFLQVHILESPPYRVLLGRPFDVLTSSTLKTHPDGSSELTINDPNMKKTAVVPTYKRGAGPEDMHRQNYQAFCPTSMNLVETEERLH